MILSSTKDKLKDTLEEIALNCHKWMSQWEVVAANYVLERKGNMKSLKVFSQVAFGLFIKPHFDQNKNVYIFQGLRNKEYMAIFEPNSVVIVGSHLEKEFAIKHGYGFCWAFPIQGAIYSKMIRNWDYPGIRQLNFWIKKLSKCNRVIFFLQEDTQPLGTFFVYLGKLLPSIVNSVCIQHGFFLKYYYPIRNDGEISDVNFVWKFSQSKLIKSNKLKTYEIGLPYHSIAKPMDMLNVVLVGTGMMGSGSDIYDRSINAYFKICKALINVPGIKILYRPHPNEVGNKNLIAYLSKLFFMVENQHKVQQLNGPQSIFVGVESSLLFEAGIACHFVAHLKLDESVPDFYYDFQFNENETKKLIDWIRCVADRKLSKKIEIQSIGTPQERFKLALHESGLVPFN
jgi:hypothetical protein